MRDDSGSARQRERLAAASDDGGSSSSADDSQILSASDLLAKASLAAAPLLRDSASRKGKNKAEDVVGALRLVLAGLTGYVAQTTSESAGQRGVPGLSRTDRAMSDSPPGEGALEVEIGRGKLRGKAARTGGGSDQSAAGPDKRRVVFDDGVEGLRVLYQLLHLLVHFQRRSALPSSLHPSPPPFLSAYDYSSRPHAPLAPYIVALAKTIRDQLKEDGRLRVQEVESDDEDTTGQLDTEAAGDERDWGQAAGIACLYLVAALTGNRNKARTAWECLHSHELSGVGEADDLCRLALEKSQACLPPSRGSITATQSFVAESRSPGYTPASELSQADAMARPAVLTRVASIVSMASSMFSMRSRCLADPTSWKSTSSLPQLATVRARANIGGRSTHVSESGMTESERAMLGRSGHGYRVTPAMRSLRQCEAAHADVLRIKAQYGATTSLPPRKRSRPEMPVHTSWISFGRSAADAKAKTMWQAQEQLDEDDLEAATEASSSPSEVDTATGAAKAETIDVTRGQPVKAECQASLQMVGRLASTPRQVPPLSAHRRASAIGKEDEGIARAQSSPGLPGLLSTSAATIRAEPPRRDAPIRLPSARSSPQLHPARRAFENDTPLPPIDPAFQRKEDLSVFTRANACAVCDSEGVNFPSCRKCGITFCSRECRIGTSGAGDGKRHVCGMWEARRLLKPPVVTRRTPMQVLAAA